MSLSDGTRLGAYEITGQIGSGGMGEVYRATDSKLGRDVAIKTLPAALASDEDRLARFEREAKLLASLNHPHIASIYSLDEHEGTLYLAMELVEGETLEDKLEAGALPVEEALRLALQIAEALEAAHEKGVIHRDLKPANVMVNLQHQVKVLDFGLAKGFSGNLNEASPAHSPALSLAMTQQGLVLGTAGYMSPEQASGQGTDQRTDIWAFGVVLYEMLTGLPLFSGESVPHILADVLKTDPDWSRLPENLHPRLRLMLQRCLTKKPRNRYHSIADARVDIEDAMDDPLGITPAADTRAAVPARPMALRLAVAVAAGAAVAAGLVAWALRSEPEPKPVNRFAYTAPEGQAPRSAGRSVIALSRDGRHFVYNTLEGLYLRSMDDLEARPIPRTEENLANPFFSPDGQSVAYVAATGQLKRVALSGGAPIVITSGLMNPFGASWGSDGNILYGQSEGIYRVPADGGTPELVIPAEDGELLYGPELMPDGDLVLFSALDAGDTSWDQGQVVVQSLSSGDRTVLVSGGSDAHYLPSGHLVYALGDGLFAVAFDTATRSVSGGAVSLVQGLARAIGGTAAANYGIADDGTLVYAADLLGIPAASVNTPVWVDRDGMEEPFGLEGCVCASASVSPDGTRIAFHEANIDITQSDIWVWSFTQRKKTRLTFENGLQVGPVWSPDSTRIAYSTVGEGVFVRSADGTGMPEQLLRSSSAVVWDWPSDDELIFTDGGDIAVLSLTGDRERRSLTTTNFTEYRPSVSPDGRWIAYESNESGQLEVYVRPFPGVDAGKWLVSSGGGQEPDWSRDGQTLFYFGPTSMMEAAIGDGPAFTWDTPEPTFDHAPYNSPGVPPRAYAVSPDGQRFLMWKNFVSETARPADMKIIVVQNWVEDLERRVPTE